MSVKKSIMIIIILMIISQPFMVQSLSIDENVAISNPFASANGLPNVNFNDQLLTIQGAGGEDPLLSNIVPDSGFEHLGINGGPSNFYFYGDGYVNINSSYQDDVYSGSYASLISSKGTSQFSQDALNNRGLSTYLETVYLDQNITCSFNFKNKANPDISNGGKAFAFFRIYNGSNYWIYYYLSASGSLPENSTSTAYYDLREDIGTWYQFNRSVTNDFLAVFNGTGTNAYAMQIYFSTFSNTNPTGFTELLIDNVKITNETDYQYASSNWDFEYGNSMFWQNRKQGPSSALLTTEEFTDGNSGLNLTAAAYYDSSYCDVYCEQSCVVNWADPYKAYYAENPGELVVDFDWKYSDVTKGGDSQYAQFYIAGYNSTTYFMLYWYLGRDYDLFDATNTTGTDVYSYFKADNFGTRDEWCHFNVDIYEALRSVNVSHIPIAYYGFHVNAGNYRNATTNLFVDEFHFTTYPAGDPSFEYTTGWSTSNPLPSWSIWGDNTYVNITSDAHTGNYAANITSHSGYGQNVAYRQCYLPVTDNLYTDFWWKINTLTNTPSSNARIYLMFNSSYTISYILGASDSYIPANGTYQKYIYIDDFNQTGVWKNLVRNVHYDANEVIFESNWVITEIWLSCFSAAGKVSTIFDDIHFVKDNTPPQIQNVGLQNTPTYLDDAIIQADVTDGFGIQSVQIYYQNDTLWYTLDATNVFDTLFVGIIPTSEYGISYKYYINATDIYGNINIDDNSGVYYSFVVADLVDPYIEITSPSHLDTLTGIVPISVIVNDDGSDINHVDFYIDSELIGTASTTPYQIAWNTRTVINEMHQINCTVYDNAGNVNSTLRYVNTDNDFAAPLIDDRTQSPTAPEYYQPVIIQVSVTDDNTVNLVNLYHKINDADWEVVEMAHTSGSIYSYTIIAQDWNTEVFYYFTATDEFDQLSSLGSELTPYYYVVGDTVDPQLDVTGPIDTTIKGEIDFLITCADLGSGLKFFQFLVGESTIYNETYSPTTLRWNTRTVKDGNYQLTFRAIDNAGNIRDVTFNYTIDNPPVALIASLTSIGTIGLIGGGVAIYYFVIRKRRIA
ncbi:MAG: Ig-like domain-containing protein [Candidatus Thorarchaeota archaeon]